MDAFEKDEEEECGWFEEGGTKEKTDKGAGKRGEREQQEGEREQCFPRLSFLDSCLLDDRIKESFNMTSALFFKILTRHLRPR